MKEKHVLIVSDMVGYEAVALSMMIPTLNALEVKCSYLPTAMISNIFSYDEVVVKELTEYMEDTVSAYKKLGIEFDMIVTGALFNKKQAHLITDLVKNQIKKPYIISDPIMGDNGELYKGLSDEMYEVYLKMIESASLITPNMTELTKLLEVEYQEVYTHEEVLSLLEMGKAKGIPSILVTSVHTTNGMCVYGYEEQGTIFKILYDEVPCMFGGSGDLFTSIVTSSLVKGTTIQQAAKKAVEIVAHILNEEIQTNTNPLKVIQIQKYIEVIQKMMKD